MYSAHTANLLLFKQNFNAKHCENRFSSKNSCLFPQVKYHYTRYLSELKQNAESCFEMDDMYRKPAECLECSVIVGYGASLAGKRFLFKALDNNKVIK